MDESGIVTKANLMTCDYNKCLKQAMVRHGVQQQQNKNDSYITHLPSMTIRLVTRSADLIHVDT